MMIRSFREIDENKPVRGKMRSVLGQIIGAMVEFLGPAESAKASA
jgi:hypothetical protein